MLLPADVSVPGENILSKIKQISQCRQMNQAAKFLTVVKKLTSALLEKTAEKVQKRLLNYLVSRVYVK
jgi:hypothetical protein